MCPGTVNNGTGHDFDLAVGVVEELGKPQSSH
jgi:hypothetical protein